MSSRRPNFIYIGTSKAGSTWLFDLLSRHPQIFVTPRKGLYYFDHHFDQGWSWYEKQFADASSEQVIGEISHSYLYSPVACERIAEMNPEVKLMACLREPVDRAVSMYLDGLRNGKWSGTFEQRCADTREIIDEGFYARHLIPYLERFPREQIHIALFDQLCQDPQKHANRIFDALGVSAVPLHPKLLTKVMPANEPRSKLLVQASKQLANLCGQLGLKKLRGRAKRSRCLRHLLYRPLSDSQRPTLSPQARADLKRRFRPEVEQLDSLLGTRLCELWNYSR